MTTKSQNRARERVLVAVRAQLREAASDALADAFEQLEARVLRHGGRHDRVRRGIPMQRTREVLERDRAIASATLDGPAPRPDARAPNALGGASAEAPTAACDEPIRTRTMAKLLAAQGHPERALAIYTYLLARDGSDPSLDAEIAALRPAQARS